jgi:hypothetical protein
MDISKRAVRRFTRPLSVYDKVANVNATLRCALERDRSQIPTLPESF